MHVTDKTQKPTAVPAARHLLDEKAPIRHRARVLAAVCRDDPENATAVLEKVLKAAAGGGGRDRYEEKRKALQELIEALETGALRPGTFINLAAPNGTPLRRAHVKLNDGTTAYPVVPDEKLAEALEVGDCVLLSGRAEAVLGRDPHVVDVGEEARLEDDLGGRVEVSLHTGDERHVLHAAQPLRRRLAGGEVPPGSRLLVCLRRAVAFDVAPSSADRTSRFRFLSREPLPDVVAERDIGDPPAFIEQVAEICRREMRDPARRRRYGLRRCQTLLLTGVSGSGKTLCLSAAIRRIHDVMSEVTGRPLDELPPRIIRLKMAALLSMWLGASDRNAEKLVDEIVALSDQTVTLDDGTSVELPVIVVLEELDGIARRRGLDHDGVYDRIQTTLLQRLDHTANRTLRDRLIFIFATTNVPQLIDPAWIRRVGGRTFAFGRLRRAGFTAVLAKLLGERPLAGPGGDEGRHRLARNVAAALFADNGAEEPLVEIQLAGTAAPCRRFRRDFLTGSVVDRAVQQAADEACTAEEAGDESGITAAMLLRAIDEQVAAVVGGMTAGNVAEFVNLPDGARVTGLRRLQQPAVRASELERR